MLESLYSVLHSKLQGLHKPIQNLEERLTAISTVIKIPRVAIGHALAVGIISAIVTSLVCPILSLKKPKRKSDYDCSYKKAVQ